MPRLVGTPGHHAVRVALCRELQARGLEVDEWRFHASAWRLTLVAAAGAALCIATVPPAAILLVAGAPDLTALARVAALTALVAWPVCASLGVLLGRRTEGVNLAAVRPAVTPVVWLVAHYDSKGQPISMLWRLVGAGATALQLCVLAALAAGVVPGPGAWPQAAWFVPGILGGALLAMNIATAASPGAVDNASGVLSVFATLDRLPPDAPVGVMLPDAEELGLVGARALRGRASQRLFGTAVINFDGIADRGPTRALMHRPGPVAAAVAAELGARCRRWLPVAVDGLVLAAAAWECVTLLRGDWRTAMIVHTPRDAPARLTLAGVAEVAEGVARAVRRMTR